MRKYFAFFFFNDPTTTEIYTLSLHDALPIYSPPKLGGVPSPSISRARRGGSLLEPPRLRCLKGGRSEEHTSELQSHVNLVCRLLLEKKKVSSRTICARFAARLSTYQRQPRDA